GQTKHRTLTAHIDGAAGDTLYFDKFVMNRPVHVDSLVLDAQGSGTFSLPAMPLDFCALSLGPGKALILLLDSAENPTVAARADSLSFPTRVEGSVNTELLHGYFKQANAFDEQRAALADRLRNNPQDSAAMAEFAALSNTFLDESHR